MASGLYVLLFLCLTSGLIVQSQAGQCCKTCKQCPTFWTQMGKRCYLYQHVAMTWAGAEETCLSYGGTLTSYANLYTYNFLQRVVHQATNNDTRVWIGGHDAVNEGQWQWTDGTRFRANQWTLYEPSNMAGENCLEMNYAGGLNDDYCTEVKPFICGMRL